MENYQSFVGFVGYEYLIKAQNTWGKNINPTNLTSMSECQIRYEKNSA